jgi:alpha-1,6-mannosyltransferase
VKIADLTQAYSATGGGVRTYLHAKREWLRDRSGHGHVLIVPGAADTEERDGRLALHTVAAPVVPGCAPYRLPLRWRRVAALLEREAPDVIETGSPELMTWVALGHRRRHGAPVAAFCHTDVAGAYVDTALDRLRLPSLKPLARRSADAYLRALYGRCDVTFVASLALAERLRAIGVPRVELLPLGVDTAVFTPARRDDALRRELGATGDDVLIVYAGRLDVEKRPDLVLEAFARLPATLRAALVVLGDGPLRDPIATRARSISRVRLLPYEQDRTRLARLLASCDLYASAAAHETFGLSVLEAQACGLPVVGVRSGAMIERVPASLGALARPGSAEDIATAITHVALNGRREMGRRARQAVEAGFGWGRTFENQLAVYERLRGRA